MTRLKRLIVLNFLFFLVALSGTSQAKGVHIALLKDGPAQKEFLSEAEVKQEIVDLLGNEFKVSFVDSDKSTANWSIQSINQVIERNFSDPKVDIIVTLGVVSSNEIAKRKRYPKPTIAALTIDPAAQSFPISNNRSGKTNFNYIADVKEAGHELVFFRDFVGKRKFAVLIEPILADSWPEFKKLLDQGSQNFNVEFIRVPVIGDPITVINSIPGNVEAAVVGVLSQYSDAEVRQLAEGLIQRKLPSYTFVGEQGVRDGFLVTINQMSQARLQMARRLAINIQKILLGANARDLPVNMQFNSRVVYNQKTGLAIGFAPRWDDVEDAEIINQEQYTNRRAFSVQEAVAFAMRNNLDLQAASIDVNLADKDVELAKSNLYPSLSLGTGYSRIKESQAIVGVNPEMRTDAQLDFSQLLYSESAWANHDISQQLLENQSSVYHSNQLDIAQAAATAYLNLLRAKADEEIRASNLEVTRQNLELAENRLRVGASGKSDLLRWKSQLASDRKDLLSSDAARRNAELELARVMNLPDGILVDAREPKVGDLLSILIDSRFKKFVTNEIQWQAFQDFYKREAIKNSPELSSFDALLKASERELLANQRGHYVPDVSLTAQAGRNLNQSGVGAVDDIEKNSWTVGVQASLSFDLSGQRKTTTNRIGLQQRQLVLQRQASAQRIQIATGQALFNIGSSFPGIELSHESAAAASESLELVRNAYAKGKVSIADLLDAQNNALSARLLAADAEYSFLQDYVILMRTAGDFKPLLNGKYSVQWFDKLNRFFKQKGIDTQFQQER